MGTQAVRPGRRRLVDLAELPAASGSQRSRIVRESLPSEPSGVLRWGDIVWMGWIGVGVPLSWGTGAISQSVIALATCRASHGAMEYLPVSTE